MKVLTASSLGFCNGVKRAVSLAHNALDKASLEGRKLYFYGSLVHNEAVCRPFAHFGAVTVERAVDIEKGSIAVIRAHGIRDSERSILENNGVEIVDATCPVVAHSQTLIRSSLLPVLIFGYKGHSEVDTLMGSREGSIVISSEKDFESIEKVEYNCVVQTTFSAALADELLEKASRQGIGITMMNRICAASSERRNAVEALFPNVDGFVVVGDRNSANTRELLAVAEKSGKPSFLVAGEEEIPAEVFSLSCAGLTAGASTSEEVYLAVKRRLEE